MLLGVALHSATSNYCNHLSFLLRDGLAADTFDLSLWIHSNLDRTSGQQLACFQIAHMYDSRLAIPPPVEKTHPLPQVAFQSHCMYFHEHLWSPIGDVAYLERVKYRIAHKDHLQHRILEFLCLKHFVRSN